MGTMVSPANRRRKCRYYDTKTGRSNMADHLTRSHKGWTTIPDAHYLRRGGKLFLLATRKRLPVPRTDRPTIRFKVGSELPTSTGLGLLGRGVHLVVGSRHPPTSG